MLGIGPMEYLIVDVIVLLLFGRLPPNFPNNGRDWPFSFGEVPVTPTREPTAPPEETKPDWIIQDQPSANDQE
jgi:hypothetical protein